MTCSRSRSSPSIAPGRVRRTQPEPQLDRPNSQGGQAPLAGNPPSTCAFVACRERGRSPGEAGRRGEDKVIDRLEAIARRYHEIESEMARPEVASDHEQLTKLAREQRTLRDIVQTYEAYLRARQEFDSARELQKHERDPEMQEYMRAEEHRASLQVNELEEKLKELLLPMDPNDDRDVVVEVHGHGAYSQLKVEGGVHRVQRVPKTEAQGRIHTSAATVAVMPEADPVEVEIKPEDLEIKTSTSTGPGGQRVNTPYPAIPMTHTPTGLVVSMQDEKSQLQNREKALRVLRARLYDLKLAEQQAAIGAERRSMVGTGGRSEKIRTYNFKENRVTDHRIKLTLHRLDSVMNGDLDELVAALVNAERTAQLNGGNAA